MSSIYIYCQFIKPGRVGGAEHMANNLISALASLSTKKLCVITNNTKSNILTKSRFVQEQIHALKTKWAGDTLLCMNYFTPIFLPWNRPQKVVTVIHDLQYRHYPKNFSFIKRVWLYLAHRHTLFSSDKVVVISKFVKSDILNQYGVKYNDKVIVIYNPISWYKNNFQEFMLPCKDYILCVAAQYPHKNLRVIIESLTEIRKKFPNTNLVLIGQLSNKLVGGYSNNSLIDAIKKHGLTDQVKMTGYVDTKTLVQYYRGAKVFVFPSEFEGFGMPAIESLGYGKSTIISNQSALTEVTQGLAVIVNDFKNPASWASQICSVLANQNKYRPSVSSIKAIRKTYNSKRIAQQYLRVL